MVSGHQLLCKTTEIETIGLGGGGGVGRNEITTEVHVSFLSLQDLEP